MCVDIIYKVDCVGAGKSLGRQAAAFAYGQRICHQRCATAKRVWVRECVDALRGTMRARVCVYICVRVDEKRGGTR